MSQKSNDRHVDRFFQSLVNRSVVVASRWCNYFVGKSPSRPERHRRGLPSATDQTPSGRSLSSRADGGRHLANRRRRLRQIVPTNRSNCRRASCYRACTVIGRSSDRPLGLWWLDETMGSQPGVTICHFLVRPWRPPTQQVAACDDRDLAVANNLKVMVSGGGPAWLPDAPPPRTVKRIWIELNINDRFTTKDPSVCLGM